MRKRAKKSIPTSSELEQRLSKYVSTAAATGVALIAFSQPTAAEIVYTPANQPINPNTVTKIDVNNDGIADFEIQDTVSTAFFSIFARLFAIPIGNQNKIWGHTNYSRGYASALLPGFPIFAKGEFLPERGKMADLSFLGGARPFGNETCSAAWANVHSRYLGLKFVINGETHFGWARLDVSCSLQDITVSALLTGYAYETVPNKAIRAGQKQGGVNDDDSSREDGSSPEAGCGEPATLGRLAQGASGIAAWRVKGGGEQL